jgi:hypothetical protein
MAPKDGGKRSRGTPKHIVEAWRNAEFQRGRQLPAQKLLIAVLPKVPNAGVRDVD